MATINGIKAGTTTITASYTDGGVTKTASVSFTVNSVAATLTFAVNSTSLTYTGNAQKIGTITYTGDSSGVYYLVKTNNSTPAANDSGWTKITSWTSTSGETKTFNVNQTNAGTYYVFLKADAGTSYNAVSIKLGNSTGKAIAKASQSAPTVTGNTTTYDTSGSISGSASGGGGHGTLYYKIDTAGGTNYGNATTTAPSRSRSSVGTTSFVAYWGGDDNYNASSNSSQGKLKVDKATPTLTLANTDVAYHNTAKITGTASVAGTIYWGTTSATSGMTNTKAATAGTPVDITTRTALGSTTVYAYFVPTDTTNYNSLGSSSDDHASKTMTVSKASDASVTVSKLNASTLTYNGSAQTLVAAADSTSHGTSEAKIGYKLGSAATADNQITWVNAGTALTATTAGTYYIYKKWTADGNHSNNQTYTAALASNTKVINKATPTLTLTNTDAVFHNTASVSATASVAGTIYWGTASNSMTNNKAATAGTPVELTTRTTLGSTTVYAYFVPTDTTNYNSLGTSSSAHTSKAMTVSQATDASVSVTLASNAGSYNTAATLVTAANSTSHGTSSASVGYKYGSAATADNQITWVNVGTALTLAATASAGTYYIYKKWTADANHSNNGSYTQVGTLTRGKINGSGSVTMSGWTYGGTVTNPSPSSSTNGTSNVTYTWYNSSKTALSAKPTSTSAAGTYYVKATFAATTNYNAYTTDYVQFTIPKKGVTVTWGTSSWVYDGSTHSTSCSVTDGLVGSDTCSVTLSNNSVGAAVGSQTVSATLGNSNYTISSGGATKSISITARPVTYTATDQSKAYDGSKLSANNEATLTSGTLVSGHTATITGSGSTSAATAGSTGTKTITVVIKNSGGTDVSSNYNITTVNGTLTITQAPITIPTPTNYSGTYDAASHTATFPAATGASITSYRWSTTNGSNWTTSTTNPGKVNAGTYYVQAYYTADSNHSGSGWSSSASIAIAKKAVTVTGKNATKAFDGTALTLSSATVANKATLSGQVSGHTLTAVTCSGTITYFGTANNTPSTATIKDGSSTDVTSNYTITYTAGTLTITKATPVLTITGVNQTYTGTPYYSTVTKTDAKGTLYWKKGSAPTTSSYGGTVDISNVGTPVGNPSALSTPVNITSVTNDADDCQLYWLFVPSSAANSLASGQKYSDNFNQASGGPVAMTINKAANANVSVTLTPGTLVYNGAAQTLATATSTGTSEAKIGYKKGSAATDDSQITWVNVGTNLQATDAGTYFIYRKWTADANHSNSQAYDSVDTIEIDLRPIKVTASSASRAYNGSALTSNSATAEATGTNRGLVSGHSMTSVTVNGSQTYVGSSNNVASSAVIKSGSTDVTSNYNITYVNGTLTISKAEPVVTVTGVTKDYTGGQFYATAKVNAKGTLYWKKGSAPTTSSNDGSVPITAINTNTNITSVKDNSDDFVLYWLFVPSSTANSLSSGHTYAENFTNAGGSSSDKVNLTINPRSITNATASATAVTYNGSQQTASVSITDAGGNLTSSDYTISGNTGTNATDYTITITGKNNYTGTKTITWTINKRAVTITAGSDTKTYDGTALTKNTVTASAQNDTNNTGMISSHHVHTWTVSGSQTLAGSSNNVVSAATIYDGATHGGSGDSTDVTSNYTITYAKGTLTVNKAAITYTATNQTKVYDGSKLTAANTASRTAGIASLPSGHSATFTCTGEIGPAVSSGTKTLSAVVIKNSSNTDVTSSFTITKKNGTLSITNATITYSTSNSVTKTCTDSATATTTTIGTREVVIASASASGVGSPTITYSINQDGWSVSSDGKKIIIPEGVAAGTYNVNVSAAAANHTTKTNGVSVVISPVSLTGIAMELNATAINYGSSTTVKTVTATYSNGATKSVIDDATYTSNPTGIVTIS